MARITLAVSRGNNAVLMVVHEGNASFTVEIEPDQAMQVGAMGAVAQARRKIVDMGENPTPEAVKKAVDIERLDDEIGRLVK